MGILAQQPALPLWPQPDHSTESNQAANQGIGQPGDNKLLAVQGQQLQGIYRCDRKAHRRPAVALANDQVAHQGHYQHSGKGITFRDV